jgi:hypothetical protein
MAAFGIAVNHLPVLAMAVFLTIRGAAAFSIDRLIATASPMPQPTLARS